MAQKITKKQTLIQTLKFAAFSMGAGVIQTVTFTLLNEVFHLNYWAAYLPALVLSVLFNFTVNRKFTFKSAILFRKVHIFPFVETVKRVIYNFMVKKNTVHTAGSSTFKIFMFFVCHFPVCKLHY